MTRFDSVSDISSERVLSVNNETLKLFNNILFKHNSLNLINYNQRSVLTVTSATAYFKKRKKRSPPILNKITLLHWQRL